MTGVVAVPSSAMPPMDARAQERAFKLAPDLRITRDRMTPARVIAWLTDPKAVKPDSDMPKIALTDAEVKDLAAYIMTAELGATPSKPKLDRLPVLTRKLRTSL